MQNIIVSIIRLRAKIKKLQDMEDQGNERLHSLKCRLMGQLDGMRYALEMVGLRFEYTDTDGKQGQIVSADYVRGPLFD